MNRLEKFVDPGKLTPAVKNKYKELAEIVTDDRSDLPQKTRNFYCTGRNNRPFGNNNKLFGNRKKMKSKTSLKTK
jgi:hypothetical protein